MKYFLVVFLLAVICFFSCKTGNTDTKLFSTNNLITETFLLQTDKDTVLQTQNGALLKIPAGTLENKNGKTVTLEIKEAYSLQQIIKAGLFTQSNGQPLSSGGMIYINAAKGEDVVFKGKINVALPSDNLQKGMQLYKGEEQSNGSINWTQPDTLPENKQLTAIDSGRILFNAHCANCHKIGEQSTGPDLAHFSKRFPGGELNWPYYLHFTDWNSLIGKTKDTTTSDILRYNYPTHFENYRLYKCNLINQFASVEPEFPELIKNQDAYHSIFTYIENESNFLNLPMPSHAYLKDCVDSCYAYTSKVKKLNELKQMSETKREELIKEAPAFTNEEKIKIGTVPEPPVNFDNLVSPANNKAVYYQFSIETFGWYNIDILLNDKFGNQESELFVRLTGQYKEKVEMFLIIPSDRIYVKAGLSEDNSRYAFGFKNGKIFLPQNTKACIVAFSESSSSVFYSSKEFTTGVKQDFEIELQASSMENFNQTISSICKNQLEIKVSETKNADAIRITDTILNNIDKELKNAENLKPKNCDCNCWGQEKDSLAYKKTYPSNIEITNPVVPYSGLANSIFR